MTSASRATPDQSVFCCALIAAANDPRLAALSFGRRLLTRHLCVRGE